MSQLYVICFDVADKKRLRHVAIQMQNVGQRVQYSLFECHLKEKELAKLQQRLTNIINPKEDHIRYYKLCDKDKNKITLDGRGQITQDDDYYFL